MWFGKRNKSDSKESKCIFIPSTMLEISGNPYAGNVTVDLFVVDPANPLFCCKDSYLCKNKLCSPDNPNEIIEGYQIVASTNMYTEYLMSDDIYIIGYQSFKYSKIESVVMSPNIYVIGAEAFYGCENLQIVDFYYSTQRDISIGRKAFANCKSLENIVLPARLTKINGDAFLGTNALVEMWILSATPPQIIDYDRKHPCLGISNKNLELHVPECALDAYRNADGWKDFTLVGEIIPNQDLFAYCLQDKNATSYYDLESEMLPLSLEVSEKEVSILFKKSNLSDCFKKTYVDLSLLLSHLFAASHKILVGENCDASKETMCTNLEIASFQEDVIWYTDQCCPQNHREIFRFDRASYVKQIKKVVLDLIRICDQNPSIVVRPYDLFSIDEIKALVYKMGWI